MYSYLNNVSKAKINIFLLYILAFSASPSILRAISGSLPEVAAIVFIIFNIIFLRIKPNSFSIASIIYIFTCLPSIFIINKLSLGEGTASAMIGIFAVYMLLAAYPYLNQKLFRDTISRHWKWIFTIVSIMAILTSLISYIAPELFSPINFNDIFPGNNRRYEGFITGLYVNESFGSFEKHRIVGIMTEPAKMSMIFLINAYLGLLANSAYFSRTFGWLNLVAGLVTFSTTYFIGFILISFIIIYKKSKVLLSIAVLISIILLFQSDYNISNILSYTSFENRLRRLFDFIDLLLNHKQGLVFGLVWFVDDFFQYPSTIAYHIYTSGLIGAVLFLFIICSYIKSSIILLSIIIIFSFSLTWQSYLIVSLALIVVAADIYNKESLQFDKKNIIL